MIKETVDLSYLAAYPIQKRLLFLSRFDGAQVRYYDQMDFGNLYFDTELEWVRFGLLLSFGAEKVNLGLYFNAADEEVEILLHYVRERPGKKDYHRIFPTDLHLPRVTYAYAKVPAALTQGMLDFKPSPDMTGLLRNPITI